MGTVTSEETHAKLDSRQGRALGRHAMLTWWRRAPSASSAADDNALEAVRTEARGRAGPVDPTGNLELWVQAMRAELHELKELLCGELDKCSEHLAFWKDMELRTFRKRILAVVGLRFPDIVDLESLMLDLIALLGQVEKVLYRLKSARTDKQLERTVQEAIQVVIYFSKDFNAPQVSSNDLLAHTDAFTSLPTRLHETVAERIHDWHFTIPGPLKLYWPEFSLLGFVGSYFLYSLANGSLGTWLDDKSISRRSYTRLPEHLRNKLPENHLRSDGQSLIERVKQALSAGKHRAALWLNKKFLNHVSVPSRNLINELINSKELSADIELFNEEDQRTLDESSGYLETLFEQVIASKHDEMKALGGGTSGGPEDALDSKPPDRARRLAALSVADDYENLARNPFGTMLTLSRSQDANVLRPVLINIYAVKVEMLYVLKTLDFLLKGTNFNFELMAFTPAIVGMVMLVRSLYRMLVHRGKKQHRSAVVAVQRVRFIFRDIEQLLNRYDVRDFNHVGRYSLLMHQLQATLRDNFWDQLDAKEQRDLDAILHLLTDPFAKNAKQMLLRLYRALNYLPPKRGGVL